MTSADSTTPTLRDTMTYLLRPQEAVETGPAASQPLLLPDSDDWVPDEAWLAAIAVLIEDSNWPGEQWVNDNRVTLPELRRDRWSVGELAQFAVQGYEGHRCGN